MDGLFGSHRPGQQLGFSVDVTSTSDVWFGSQEGASCIRASDGVIANYPQGSGLPGLRVRRVYTDSRNDAPWFGMIDAGAGRVSNPER